MGYTYPLIPNKPDILAGIFWVNDPLINFGLWQWQGRHQHRDLHKAQQQQHLSPMASSKA